MRPDTVQKLEVLEGFTAGTELVLDRDAVESIVRGLKAALDELVEGATGVDPEHRKIWHVQ